MRTDAKNVGYVAVGTADLTVERLREAVKRISRSTKQAGRLLDDLEKRGQRVMGRAKRQSKRASSAALRKTRAKTGSRNRSTTKTRTRARTRAPRRRTGAAATS